MKKEFKVMSIKNFQVKLFFCIAELLKEAERIRHAGSRNPKEKIDIYHEAAEACRSVGNFSSH